MKVTKLTRNMCKKLKVGNILLIQFSDPFVECSPNRAKIMCIAIEEIKRDDNGIILGKKDNIFINFDMYFGGLSAAESVMLVR